MVLHGDAAVSVWVAGLGSAILIKLSSSIDDVVWLAPFLTANTSYSSRMSNATTYLSVCLIQTMVAMFIATSGNKTVEMITGGRKDVWSTERILTVGAGILLALYSVKLTYEYFHGEDDEDVPAPDSGYGQVCTPEAASNEVELANTGPPCEKVTSRPLSNRQNSTREIEHAVDIDKPGGDDKISKKEGSAQQTLFVIAFMGSVDDLTLFVPMLVGKGFDIFQLMLGAFIAASAIVAMCIFLGLCKPIADCLSKIPLALIVVVFATTLLAKGYVME